MNGGVPDRIGGQRYPKLYSSSTSKGENMPNRVCKSPGLPGCAMQFLEVLDTRNYEAFQEREKIAQGTIPKIGINS